MIRIASALGLILGVVTVVAFHELFEVFTAVLFAKEKFKPGSVGMEQMWPLYKLREYLYMPIFATVTPPIVDVVLESSDILFFRIFYNH